LGRRGERARERESERARERAKERERKRRGAGSRRPGTCHPGNDMTEETLPPPVESSTRPMAPTPRQWLVSQSGGGATLQYMQILTVAFAGSFDRHAGRNAAS